MFSSSGGQNCIIQPLRCDIYFIPLHVSSTMCSSSGGQNCIIQPLVSGMIFISCLYMFRAPCARHQEVKIVLYNLWYHHTYRCDDVYLMPLHVSSTMCSSSGGQNCIIQPLVSGMIFISCLYMFRAPCDHHQKVKILLYNLWYHHTYSTPIGVMIPEVV